MATCPNCFNAIDHLVNRQLTETVYHFELVGQDHDFSYIDEALPEDGDFECPECKSCLFTDTADAYAFLKYKAGR